MSLLRTAKNAARKMTRNTFSDSTGPFGYVSQFSHSVKISSKSGKDLHETFREAFM